MSDIAVRVENLGKRYQLGSGGRRKCGYNTFRDSLVRNLGRRWRQITKSNEAGANGSEILWALKDVSFEVKQGEIIGLIGRNGAGKSTLLKLLSRITEPTEGEALVYGRVGSLLEVGTGFHPELTGRENTYLNGAILGMKRAEINRKFDEIVAFAEVEKFIDTPAKHYSSGMFLRLAFSVAAHLETEILLVDEVLAVGDAAFQRRCLGKMGEVAHQGRTVFLVSHNMGAINSLCPISFLLENGMLMRRGPSSEVVSEYLGADSAAAYTEVAASHHIRGDQAVKVERVLLTTMDGEPASEFNVWEPMRIHVEFSDTGAAQSAFFWITITGSDGQVVLSSLQSDNNPFVRLPAVENGICATVPGINLTPGDYLLSVGIAGSCRNIHDLAEHVLAFKVRPNFHHGGPFDGRVSKVTEQWQWESCGFPEQRPLIAAGK